MQTESIHQTRGMRIFMAKQKLSKKCKHCGCEHSIFCNDAGETLVAFCKQCGGRAKDRIDENGIKRPSVDVVLVTQY